MKYLFTVLISLCLLGSYSSYASDDWSATGHRVVGKIADQYLKSRTKRKIKKLLNHQSLALVSTHADDIKSDKRFDKFYTWHFINMPLESNYEDSKKSESGDLVTAINHCVKIIKDDTSSEDDKAFYLKLLIHFIGDLHQPMHIGLVEDKGGNDFKLQWFYKNSNLHSVWDREMIEGYNMSYSELADNANVLTKQEVKSIQEGTLVDWVNDTHTITRQVYAHVKREENLRYQYSYDNFETVRTQLQKGGIRLAKVLNDLF
ncbi:MAG: S1/P1 nuclease [Flavobacteriales bacterium]|nr:S1/P1 nuclease [Flavobacteriia bacterium]NCP06055.1 S1/P1 nuclease [Flavobacteriales bacterium]PIV92938.1 MAG: S1/P1 Nuclease [Flavobacteriaceae bacterium CG17_big_fil_post_rev_8_21_14_2_50_33_15]PIY12175.1 MAG: S1/P1 Nuclease [Flavobacteriaceae bacterium CG_4_10_14_3_um_filter_33_47]PJB19038.1 MAG: S1/P1 Nuclease [Flavobacteriaceae bacterium CG_4_9_14_3_um_filter_33_16]